MNRKLAFGLTLAALALALALPSSARGFGRMFDVNRLAEPLGLDADQVSAIEKIQDDTANKVIDLRGDEQKLRYEIGKLMSEESPKQAKIFDLIDEAAQVRAKIQKTRVSSMLAVRAVLTPDQRDKLAELRMSRRQMGKARGPRGGHRFGRRPVEENEPPE